MMTIRFNFYYTIILVLIANFLFAQPDLIINEHALRHTFEPFVMVNNDSCFINEGCMTGYGTRQIIRFSTLISNIGDQDFYVGKTPSGDPSTVQSDLWEYDNCHDHWHYEGYAEYNLLDSAGNPTSVGFKNGFCLADIACKNENLKKYDCKDQGISAQCTDVYSYKLPCQWIDVTGIPDGFYKFEMKINAYERADFLGREESSYDNNSVQICFELFRNANGEHFINILGNGSVCDGSGGANYPCESVTFNLLFDQYPQETVWEIKDTENNTLFSGGPYNSANANTLMSEVLCLPYGCYNFTIFDSRNDGICCDFGSGYYHVVNASGEMLFSGGAFDSNEINSFCVGESITCTDNDGDGICVELDCNDNDASFPAPAGVACDDNNPLTHHDEIGPDGCSCIGLAIDENSSHLLQLGFQFDSYPSETSWEIHDMDGNSIIGNGPYSDIQRDVFSIETIPLPSGCYSLIMKDNFGDGMCCNYQSGYYNLTDTEGTILAEGDSFGTEEISNFCIAGCEEILFLTNSLINTKAHYKANNTIIGNNAVTGEFSDVIFDASRVTLNSGFKTETTANFKVRNSGCAE